jgi:hypothetical protein
VHRCKDGYVKVYIQGQEEEHKYDKPDYEFCGKTNILTFWSRVLLYKSRSQKR